MKKPSSIVTLCVLVTFVLAFQVSPSMADTDREDICTWNFEATVRQGPHAGESFAGTLTVVIAKHGTLTGVLVTDAPETILVVGQVNGRAVNLAVALQEIDQETEGLYLFGTGTARLPITSKTQCGGVMGGTFAGPYPGDIGDWLVCIGVRTSGGTCIGVSFWRGGAAAGRVPQMLWYARLRPLVDSLRTGGLLPGAERRRGKGRWARSRIVPVEVRGGHPGHVRRWWCTPPRSLSRPRIWALYQHGIGAILKIIGGMLQRSQDDGNRSMRRIAHDTSSDTRSPEPRYGLRSGLRWGASEAPPCHRQDVEQTFTGDLANPKLGDQLISCAEWFDEHEKEVGTGVGVCTIVSVAQPPEIEDTLLQCLLTAVFDKKGQIIFGGVAPLPEVGVVAPFGILGGTEDFRKVRGEATLTVISPVLQDAIFDLK